MNISSVYAYVFVMTMTSQCFKINKKIHFFGNALITYLSCFSGNKFRNIFIKRSTLIFIKHKQNRSFLAVKMGMSQTKTIASLLEAMSCTSLGREEPPGAEELPVSKIVLGPSRVDSVGVAASVGRACSRISTPGLGSCRFLFDGGWEV